MNKHKLLFSVSQLGSAHHRPPQADGRMFLLTAGCVGVAFLIRLALDPLWGDRLPYAIFFLADLVVAQFAPPMAFVFAVLLGFGLGDWFFVQPRHSLLIGQRLDQLNAIFYFVLNLVVLLLSLRTQRALARERTALDQLRSTLAEVKILEGLLPICAQCKNIRDDKGYWNRVEIYIRKHSSAEFTHCICPTCAKALYPEFFDESDFTAAKPAASGG
jgi:K+-sensing histidine kinase KdpD